MNKRAIFICSQKGGIGKSTFARGLLDVYRRANLEVAAFDCDGSVGQLLQHYGTRDEELPMEPAQRQEPLTGVGYFNIRDEQQRQFILDAIDDYKNADAILFDLPGETIADIEKVIGNAQDFFAEYRKEGFEPVVVIVIGVVKASARSVVSAVESFGNSVTYVVVKDLIFGSPDEFISFDGDPEFDEVGEGRAALESVNGTIIHMPKLVGGGAYGLIDKYNLRFCDVATQEAYRMGRTARSTTVRWLRNFEISLDGTVLALNGSAHSNGAAVS